MEGKSKLTSDDLDKVAGGYQQEDLDKSLKLLNKMISDDTTSQVDRWNLQTARDTLENLLYNRRG